MGNKSSKLQTTIILTSMIAFPRLLELEFGLTLQGLWCMFTLASALLVLCPLCT